MMRIDDACCVKTLVPCVCFFFSLSKTYIHDFGRGSSSSNSKRASTQHPRTALCWSHILIQVNMFYACQHFLFVLCACGSYRRERKGERVKGKVKSERINTWICVIKKLHIN